MTMIHYAQRTSDGLIHVTNAVGGYIGQHHVHTADHFKQWSSGREIKWVEGCYDCDCGQEAKKL